ncbi:MAG: nickel insertion protein, partial [Acidimicrobiia bacterium]
MSRHLHVDPVAGVSGDMLLGALFDLGAPVADVRADLALLDLPGWELSAERVTRHGITGTLATVRTTDRADHRAA